MTLLSRNDFRNGVFARDKHACVVPNCKRPAQDAHHIIERRLWPDGGYYLDNGASLCGEHHLMAEKTYLSCEELREWAGIREVVLPPHLYRDTRYDKWGNPFLEDGTRLRGELFYDESVQKVLAEVIGVREDPHSVFHERVKYPRTWHLPWSTPTKDDRTLDIDTVMSWSGHEVVVSEKMDGENTTLYRDYIHARSIDYNAHVSRDWVRNFHAQIAYDIPDGMRICGENVWAKHSIGYENLASYFLVFSIWERDVCLPWDDTLEWCKLLGLEHVPVLKRGPFSIEDYTRPRALPLDLTKQEGYVVRPAGSFTLRTFRNVVGKYVRPHHVQTHGHWMRSAFTKNRLR